MDITLTRKIKVCIGVPNSITDDKERKAYKDFAWNLLRNVNQQNFEIHNLLVKRLIEIESIMWGQLNQNPKFIQIRNTYLQNKKDKGNQKLYFDYINQERKDLIKTFGYENLSTYIYNYMIAYLKSLPEEQVYINSYTYCAISKNVCDKFNQDLFDVNRGDKHIAFYKNNQPIPINIKAQPKPNENGVVVKELGKAWFNKVEDNYSFKFKSIKKHNVELNLIFGRDKSNNRIMVDRIFNNDLGYKLCDSKIQIVENEIFLLLSIKQINITTPKLDINKVLGVDLGIKCAAYVATNNSLERKQIGDKQFVLMKTKLNIEKDKRNIQRNSIFSRSGHGRQRKLQKLLDFKTYEKNFRNTFNHKISSEIINVALQWNCGTINVEDLSVIPKELKNEKILRNWAYFDLLSKIEYKAKKNGLGFNKVNPAYTSQKCSVCGEKGSRPKQDTFICDNPNCKNHDKPVNADHNAAINIAKNINGNLKKPLGI